MPLSETISREEFHTRRIECRGFKRADGLWDIEGHMTDVKHYAFTLDQRGEIKPGEPLHEMWVRITVDDDMVIQGVEAVTDHSPYRICPEIAPNYERLIGLKIAPGFTQKLRELFGGVAGCTHLTELMGPIATTAFQTIGPLRRPPAADAPKRRPALLNTCHAFADDGPIAQKRWPDFAKPSV